MMPVDCDGFMRQLEDAEIISPIDGYQYSWYVDDVVLLEDGDVLATLVPVQCLDPETEESPVGCNSCDLGDHDGLAHAWNCPVNRMVHFEFKFRGDFS